MDDQLIHSTNPDVLAQRLSEYNAAYRRGAPLIKDAVYDELLERLRVLAPEHIFCIR